MWFGPERTRRHNALAEVIFQALLADFLEGRPAYFDVTVRNYRQQLYVTKSAVRAGAAAEAGKEQKDARLEDRVRAADGLLYPLVVETLGLWSLFSIKTLKAIASKTSVVSGLKFHQAFQSTMQQLSIQLWKPSSRMIHKRIQLEVQDIDSWDVHSVI